MPKYHKNKLHALQETVFRKQWNYTLLTFYKFTAEYIFPVDWTKYSCKLAERMADRIA